MPRTPGQLSALMERRNDFVEQLSQLGMHRMELINELTNHRASERVAMSAPLRRSCAAFNPESPRSRTQRRRLMTPSLKHNFLAFKSMPRLPRRWLAAHRPLSRYAQRGKWR